MIYVGIDVAKDKHDCYIISSEGEVIANVFTIPNTMEGFDLLLTRIKSAPEELSKVKVGLRPPDTTATTFWATYLTKVSPPMS